MQTELREDEPFLTLARTFFKSQIILTAGMLPYLLIIRGMDYLSIAIIGMIAIIIVYNGSILAERSLELKKLELGERERDTLPQLTALQKTFITGTTIVSTITFLIASAMITAYLIRIAWQ